MGEDFKGRGGQVLFVGCKVVMSGRRFQVQQLWGVCVRWHL